MSTPSNAGPARPRGLQFTLAALLAAMTIAALFCVALARPTRFWSELVVLLVVVALLTSIPAIVYRSGRARAFAIGFLVFTLGFLLALVSRELLFRTPRYGYPNDAFLSSHLGTWLFAKIHPNNDQPTDGISGLGMSVGFDSGMGSTVTGMSGGGNVMLGGLNTAMPPPPKYDPARFGEIVHAGCALLAGIAGGLLTQFLHATRKREP
ncbi:MAG TPA: hypothetical protein VFB80_09735 [Pirellulaceae bacterium]|nr:hypothetical protein [Pirellulaceae bacterium]